MADSSDSLKDVVRRCVREELNMHGNFTSQTLVNRTRNLIRSSRPLVRDSLARQVNNNQLLRLHFHEMH